MARNSGRFQVRGEGSARKEVAAYRLDRQLGLGLVPVTVEREVQGQRGVLQGRPLKWVSQAEVQQQSLQRRWLVQRRAAIPAGLRVRHADRQRGRTRESLLFDSDEWLVYVTAHDRAFGRPRACPRTSRPIAGPGAEMRRRLKGAGRSRACSGAGRTCSARANSRRSCTGGTHCWPAGSSGNGAATLSRARLRPRTRFRLVRRLATKCCAPPGRPGRWR